MNNVVFDCVAFSRNAATPTTSSTPSMRSSRLISITSRLIWQAWRRAPPPLATDALPEHPQQLPEQAGPVAHRLADRLQAPEGEEHRHLHAHGGGPGGDDERGVELVHVAA